MATGNRVLSSALSDGSSGISIALSTTSFGQGSGVLTPWDSDIEADPDPPEWTRNLDPDVVDKMTAKEKQRQEIINGNIENMFYYIYMYFKYE